MDRKVSVLSWHSVEAVWLRKKLENLAQIGALERNHAFRLMVLLQKPTKPAVDAVKAEITRALE